MDTRKAQWTINLRQFGGEQFSASLMEAFGIGHKHVAGERRFPDRENSPINRKNYWSSNCIRAGSDDWNDALMQSALALQPHRSEVQRIRENGGVICLCVEIRVSEIGVELSAELVAALADAQVGLYLYY